MFKLCNCNILWINSSEKIKCVVFCIFQRSLDSDWLLHWWICKSCNPGTTSSKDDSFKVVTIAIKFAYLGYIRHSNIWSVLLGCLECLCEMDFVYFANIFSFFAIDSSSCVNQSDKEFVVEYWWLVVKFKNLLGNYVYFLFFCSQCNIWIGNLTSTDDEAHLVWKSSEVEGVWNCLLHNKYSLLDELLMLHSYSD